MNFALTKLPRLDEHRVTLAGTELCAAKAPYHAHFEGNYQVVSFANSALVLLSLII